MNRNAARSVDVGLVRVAHMPARRSKELINR